MLKAIALVSLLVLSAGAVAQDRPAAGPEIHFTANAGVMVGVDGARFLIDALMGDGLDGYTKSEGAERAKLEAGQPPFDVDAILATHWHEDHFSAHAVAAHLSRNPRAVLVSSVEIAQRVRAIVPALAPRLKGVTPLPGTFQTVDVAGVPVRVLRIRHNKVRRNPEEHVGYLVGRSATVLHTGDADPVADNFTLMKQLPPVDVGLMPTWYLETPEMRRFVATSIAPRRIFGMHLTAEMADTIRKKIGDPSVTLLVKPVPATGQPR